MHIWSKKYFYNEKARQEIQDSQVDVVRVVKQIT